MSLLWSKTNMEDSPRAAILPMMAAMPRTPGTIETTETSNVLIVELPQATPSVAGSARGMPISHTTEQQYTLAQPQLAPAAMPQMATSGYATSGHAADSAHPGVYAASGHANDCHAVNGISFRKDG